MADCIQRGPARLSPGSPVFIIYIDDIRPNFGSRYVYFADDLKIWRPIATHEDVEHLQRDITFIATKVAENGLTFNTDKVYHLAIGQAHPPTYYLNGTPIAHKAVVRDLGVLVSADLKTQHHTDKTKGSAMRLLWSLRRSFHDWSPPTFRILFNTFIRPILEYAGPSVFPCTASEEQALESVQRLATRMIPSLRYNNYQERCETLNIFTLSYRRVRGDLILVYKVLRLGMYPALKNILPLAPPSNLRGHRLKLAVTRTDGLPHHYRLSRRVVHTWNVLPVEIIEASTITDFKSRLDKYLWFERDDKFRRRIHLPGYPRGW
jgi:ribonuclease P/MRP protein subunit RPP40